MIPHLWCHPLLYHHGFRLAVFFKWPGDPSDRRRYGSWPSRSWSLHFTVPWPTINHHGPPKKKRACFRWVVMSTLIRSKDYSVFPKVLRWLALQATWQFFVAQVTIFAAFTHHYLFTPPIRPIFVCETPALVGSNVQTHCSSRIILFFFQVIIKLPTNCHYILAGSEPSFFL